jgi:hypothetical protein
MYSDTGIIQGSYSGQQDRVDELNERIFSRYVPDNSLRPNYDPRPVSTKYAFFPIIDRKVPSKIPHNKYLGEGISERERENESQSKSSLGFLPSATNSPFMRNIDTETILRNQTTGLQHGIGQNVFVPSSTSDLYQTTIVSRPSDQPFPGLFTKPTLDSNTQTIRNQAIGKSDFFNFTRTQLRNTMIQS